MDAGKYRNFADLAHAKKCVKSLEKLQSKRPLLDKEIQEKYFWQSRVEEEYAKPARPRDYCDKDCKPTVGVFDVECKVHGII